MNIRVVQELLGHSNVNTTQDYTAVVGSHLEEAIKVLNQPPQTTVSDEQKKPARDDEDRRGQRDYEYEDVHLI